MVLYSISNIVYLDKFNKCYSKILSINKNPNDISLNNMIKTIKYEKLSIYDYTDCCNDRLNCIHVFKKDNNKFYTLNDMDELINKLIDAGYRIEYKLSKLIGNKIDNKILFYINKN